MKISTYITLIVLIGVSIFAFGTMTQEAQERYPDANINDSEWNDGRYDFVTDVNDSIAPVQRAFDDITNQEKGWFSQITSGITAIPWAIVNIPILLFTSFAWGGSILTGFLTSFGVPIYLITAGLVILIVWGIFKLVEMFHRWQV